MLLLLDAANTLIYKPAFYTRFLEVCNTFGYSIDIQQLKGTHKLLSEAIIFPDKTSREFYQQFNGELLYCLGIIPTSEMLDAIFSACSYLPWVAFDDVDVIRKWPGKVGVLSNFHKGLVEILEGLIPKGISDLVISEASVYRKPDVRFFKEAIERFGVQPNEVYYIGDSPKLDLEPGLAAGMNAWLIDRDNFYPACQRRLLSLRHILDHLP